MVQQRDRNRKHSRKAAQKSAGYVGPLEWRDERTSAGAAVIFGLGKSAANPPYSRRVGPVGNKLPTRGTAVY